ncbi:DUF202 domain-containing protein [Plasmodiophora brassicae]
MAFSTDDFLQMIDPAQLYGFGKRRTILIWTRLLSTILVLYVVVFTVVTDQDPTLYALYATYWLTMLIFLYFALATAISWWQMFKSPPSSTLERIAYVMCELALPFSITVAVGYWGVINPHGVFVNVDREISSIQNHAGMAVLISVDFILSNIVLLHQHVVFGIGLMAFYFVVNAVWTLTTNIPIYNILTWRSKSTIAYVVGSMLLFPIIYLSLASLTAKVRSGATRSRSVSELDDAHKVIPAASMI